MRMLILWFYQLFNQGYVSKNNSQRLTSLKLESDTHLKPNSPHFLHRINKKSQSAKPSLSKKETVPKNDFSGSYKELPAFVDACYFDWMAGKSHELTKEDRSFDLKLLDYLDGLAASEFAGANLIPRVPTVMLQLLKRMHEENVSGSELSRIIAKDVVLVAAILAEVNSSYYNLAGRINDLSQAILLLGHNRLRLVLAKISFTPIYNAELGAYTKLTASKIWDESQKRALICYLLAKHHQVDPFLAFLAGLMQDVGLMVALRVVDRSSTNAQLPSSTSFRDAFQQRSLVLSTRIGHIWSLPEGVIGAIEGQGVDKTALAKLPLAKVLQKGDFLSKASILINEGQLTLDMDRFRAILTRVEMDCFVTLLEGSLNVSTIL